jgi:hypothetical protein
MEGKSSLYNRGMGMKNIMTTITSLAKSYFTQILGFKNLLLKIVLVKKLSSGDISSTNQISARVLPLLEE